MFSLDSPFGKGIPLKIIIVGLILALCLLSIPVAAAVEYVDCSVNRSGLTDPLKLNISQTAAVDNLLLAQINFEGGTVTKPDESWILIDRKDGPSSMVSQALYYKRVQDTTPTTYTWTFAGSIAINPDELGTISEFSGVDWTTGPIFGFKNASGSGIYLDLPGILAVPAGSELVAYYSTAYPRTFPYLPYPGPMTLMCKYTYPGTAELRPALAAFNQSWSTTGNTSTRTLNIQSDSWWAGHLVALRPARDGNCTAPSITTQPMSVATCEGSSVTFSVSANGTEPLSYQWQKNGVDIDGAIASSLVINPVALFNGGNYTVNVSNSCEYVVSTPATLTVNTPPSITTQPMNLTRCAGSSATFNVTATGSGTLSYQWYHGSTPLTGTNSSSLVINPVKTSDAGNYYVVVSSSTGCTPATSNTATLTIKTVCISGYKNSTYNYGLPGWTIYLNGTTADGVIVPQKTTITNATGYYQFCGLDPGTYTLREQLQAAEWTQVSAPGVVNLGCNNVTNQNFTNKPINFYCTGTPYVKFTYTRLSSPAHTIQFTDTSTGPFAVKWNWKFGDGTPNSYEENPKHTYARAGTYTVTLGIKWVDCSGKVVSSTWKTTSKTITVP